MPPRPTPAKPKTISLSKAKVDKVIKDTQDNVAKRMGVNPEKLPAAVKTAIEDATATALDARLKTLILRDADRAVKGTVTAGVKPIEMLDERMSLAQEGLAHVAADGKVKGILKDSAKLLFEKFTALKSAGFADDQAFQLVLAEVKGRAGRSR